MTDDFWTSAASECNLGHGVANTLQSHQGSFLLCSCFFFIMLFTQAAFWQRILLRSDLVRKTPILSLQTRSQQGFCSTSGCEAVLSQGWLRNIKELTLGTKQRFYFDTERPKFTPRCRTRQCKSGYVRSDSHLLRGFRGVTCFKVPGPKSTSVYIGRFTTFERLLAQIKLNKTSCCAVSI